MRVLLLLLALSFTGCVNGDNYPTVLAREYCRSLYACVEDEDSIETWTTYDDEAECREERTAAIEDGAVYDQYEEGDRDFDSDAANACIDEVAQIRDDSDCGSMDVPGFLFDSLTEECDEVYPEAE